jgi:hypothetical protein
MQEQQGRRIVRTGFPVKNVDAVHLDRLISDLVFQGHALRSQNRCQAENKRKAANQDA